MQEEIEKMSDEKAIEYTKGFFKSWLENCVCSVECEQFEKAMPIIFQILEKNNIEEFKKKLLKEIEEDEYLSYGCSECRDKTKIIDLINNIGKSDQEIISEKQLDEDINIKEKI